jgi:YspA, cpYpsA-related SLOG family
MKCVIAGSRTITDPLELEKAIKLSGFQITEVVCGGAVGADELGRLWAIKNNILLKFFFPDWKTYGKSAGPLRNTQMATYVGPEGGLIALHDGISKGTADMIRKAERFNLKVYIHLVKKEEKE